VLSALYGVGSTTRRDLMETTDLNVASLSLVLRELIDYGVVHTLGKMNSSGGRKSEILRLNPDAVYFLALDLEGRRNRFGFVNLAGDVRQRWEEVCDLPHLPMERVAAGLHRILDNLSETERPRTLAIGLSYAGWSNPAGEVTAVNLGWENMPVAKTLESIFHLPVFLAPDCALKAMVEHSMGRAQGVRNYIHLSMDSGLGVGCYADGRLLRGAHGMAGEFGHITIDPSGEDPCPCGKRGCLEAIVSSPALVERYARLAGESPERLLVGTVFDRARQGDGAARETVTRAGHFLGLGLAHLVNLLDPELIVLAGDLIAGSDLFVPLIKEQLCRHALRPFVEHLEIKTSSLGQDIALKGAASLAFRQSLQSADLLSQICAPVLAPA